MPNEDESKAFDVRVASQAMRFPSYFVVTVAGFVGFLVASAALRLPDTWFTFAFLAFGLPLTLVQLWPGSLHVGPDGLVIQWLGRRVFVDAREIARLEPFRTPWENGIVVHRRSGVPVRIATRLGRLLGRSGEETLTLIRRIEGALASADARAASDHVGATLGRGSRSVGEWLADLRAIGARAVPTLRAADVTTEVLRALVEGSFVDPDVRVGAAVALAARSDEDREHVRVAAQAIGDDKIRVAIEHAVSDDDEELSRALDAIDRV